MAVEAIEGLLGNTCWAHLKIQGVSDILRLKQASITEVISESAYATVQFVSLNPNLGLDNLLGNPALLILDGTTNTPGRRFHGQINSISQKSQDRKYTHYTAIISSAIALLDKRQNVRIFQHQNEIAIIRQILKEHGITDTEFNLMGQYQQREYCVQYNETDLSFIQRLMSEAGIYSFILHKNEQHSLVVTDHPTAHQAIASPDIYFHSATGQRHDQAIITHIDRSFLLKSCKASSTDYNFKKPHLDLYCEEYGLDTDTSTENHNSLIKERADLSRLEDYRYPGNCLDPGEGRQNVTNRFKAKHYDQTHIQGRSTAKAMSAGYKFTLNNHPDRAANTEYLITEITHHIEHPQVMDEESGSTESDSYYNTFKAIEAEVPYRTSPVIKPKTGGVQTAIVTGPEGEEIYVDEYARVKVQFHWDREGQYNENSSCWIQVRQSWAGSGFGAVAIPRVGQEVIVDFINGDPDRPIITGSVYHGTNRPPYGLPENKTRTVFKTDTHQSYGSNEIRLEDLKDQQEIYIHAQKDQNNVVNNDETTSVGRNRTENIGNDEQQSIGHDRIIETGNDETRTIGNDQRTIVVRDNSIKIERNRLITIEKDLIENVNNKKRQITFANYDQETGGNYEHIIKGKLSRESVEKITVDTSHFHAATAEKLILKGPAGTITIDSSGISLKASKILIKAPAISFGSGGSQGIEKFISDVAVGQAIDELQNLVNTKSITVKNKAVTNQPPRLKQRKSRSAQAVVSTALADKKKRLQQRKDLIKQTRTKAKDPATLMDQTIRLEKAADRLEENNIAVERARLADYVYPTNHVGDDAPVGWGKIDMQLPVSEQAKDQAKNFHAEIYKSKIDGSIVLSFKGTSSLSDWGQNIKQGTGGSSYQYERAMKLAQRYKKAYGNKLQFAGHSLGGGLASAAAAVTGLPAYTYNAAGLHPNTPKDFGGSLETANKMSKSWHVKGEILTMSQNNLGKLLPVLAVAPGVGTTGAVFIASLMAYTALKGNYGMPDAAGELKTLPAVHGGGPLARHGIGHVIDGIEQQKAEDKTTMQQFLKGP